MQRTKTSCDKMRHSKMTQISFSFTANAFINQKFLRHPSITMCTYISHCKGEFLSKMWYNFRWPLGRVPTDGGITMARAEPPMQHFSK